MDSDQSNERHILRSWRSNAQAWTHSVRAGRIDSRRLVTDRAIIEAILECAPRRVLDLGCGEGWLVRALAERAIEATGVDATAELIAQARAAGGQFHLASYQQLAAGELALQADLAVCNFSLLGREGVEPLLRRLAQLVGARGRVIIQTLHPICACGPLPYRDGWREGSWDGFDAQFTDPAPWYFRTFAGWLELLAHSGLRCLRLREPLHPLTQRPASLILVAGPQH